MEVLDKFLKEQLDMFETSGSISVNQVINLESTLKELDPSLEGFITKDIPLSKFSVSQTATNLNEVKLSLKSLIALRHNEAVANDINKHSIDNIANRINEFIHFINVVQSFVGSCKDIDPVILEGFRNFKFNSVKLNDELDSEFIPLNSNVSFLQAILETDLKDIFCPNGLPKSIEDLRMEKQNYSSETYGLYTNDCLFGLIDAVIAKRESVSDLDIISLLLGISGYDAENDFKPIITPMYTYGYSLTLCDIVKIADNGEWILKSLEDAKERLVAFKNDFFGPRYIMYMFHKADDKGVCGENFGLTKTVIDAILDGVWNFEDKHIHMSENHKPLNESFIMIREVFGKNYEH